MCARIGTVRSSGTQFIASFKLTSRGKWHSFKLFVEGHACACVSACSLERGACGLLMTDVQHEVAVILLAAVDSAANEEFLVGFVQVLGQFSCKT